MRHVLLLSILFTAGCSAQKNDRLPLVDVQVQQRLLAGDEEYVPGLLRDGIALEDGNWAVLDVADAVVALLSSDLRVLHQTAGLGSGPGELRISTIGSFNPGGVMAARPGGGFGVFDSRNTRLNLYDSAGQFDSTVTGLVSSAASWTFVHQDTIAALVHLSDAQGHPIAVVRLISVEGELGLEFKVEPTRFRGKGFHEDWLITHDPRDSSIVALSVQWPVLRRYSRAGHVLEDDELRFPDAERFDPARELVYSPEKFKKLYGLSNPGRPEAELFMDLNMGRGQVLVLTSGVVCRLEGSQLVPVLALSEEWTPEAFAYNDGDWLLFSGEVIGLPVASRAIGR